MATIKGVLVGIGTNLRSIWMIFSHGFRKRDTIQYPEQPVYLPPRYRGRIVLTRDPAEAASGADIVVTDTWVSMGQEHVHNKLAAMAPFQVDEALMARAKPGARFLHCLPAHVGEEVSEGVFEGHQSVVFDEAENRIHAQKSILLWCFGLLGEG